MNNAPTLVTFLTTESLVSVPLSELELRMFGKDVRVIKLTSCLRGNGTAPGRVIRGQLMSGTVEECQQALKVIFEFIANCGQIETPSIMINMQAVVQAAKKGVSLLGSRYNQNVPGMGTPTTKERDMTNANTTSTNASHDSLMATLAHAKELMADYYENLTNPEVCAWSTLCDALATSSDELADKAVWWAKAGEWKPLESAVFEVLEAKAS